MSERVPSWPNTKVSSPGVLRCSSCDETMPFVLSHAPVKVRQTAEHRGWFIERKFKRAACPECYKKMKADNTKEEAQPSRFLRAVMAELLDGYDDAGLCYSPGWSDEVIAEKIGCSPKYVASIREEHFGPAEDARVEQLRADLMAERKRCMDDLEQIKDLLATTQSSIIARIDELGRRLASLTAKE